MPKTKHIPLCKCDCGLPTAVYYCKGRSKGYKKYANGHRPTEENWKCRKCHRKDNRYGRTSYCRKCHYEVYHGTPEARLAKRSSTLKMRYGITSNEYERMYQEQGGLCFLCGALKKNFNKESLGKDGLVVDHNHITGKVRKLICHKCNQLVGLLETTNKSFLERIMAYVTMGV